MIRRFILGVDAGMHAAGVALSFSGEVIGCFITKEGINAFIEKIRKIGIPSIIACDVAKPSFFAKKLAAIYNVTLFSPVSDISEGEKEKLSPIKDRHLRDAHAAAVLCWRKYANRIRHVLTVERSEEKASFLIHALLNGTCISEAERQYRARKQLERPEVSMVIKKESKKEQVRTKTSELLEEIIQLKKKNKRLEEENKTLRKMLERLKKKKRKEMKNTEIKKLKNKIYALLSEVKRLRALVSKK